MCDVGCRDEIILYLYLYLNSVVSKCVKGGEVKDAIDRRDFSSITVTTDEKMPFTFELSTGHQPSRIYFLAAETEEERFEWIGRLVLVSLMSYLNVIFSVNEYNFYETETPYY